MLHFCCKGHFLQRITWLYWLRMRRGIQFAQPSCLQFCSSLSARSAWPVRVSCGSWLTSHWYPPDRHLTSSFLACQTYNCFSSIVEMFLTFFLSWCIHFLSLYWHMFWERKKTRSGWLSAVFYQMSHLAINIFVLSCYSLSIFLSTLKVILEYGWVQNALTAHFKG